MTHIRIKIKAGLIVKIAHFVFPELFLARMKVTRRPARGR